MQDKRMTLRDFDYGHDPLGLNPYREIRYKEYDDDRKYIGEL